MKPIRVILFSALIGTCGAVMANTSHSNVNTTKEKIVMAEQHHKININTSDAKTLTQIKGIGLKRAEAIIAYRNTHGPFKTIDALANVKGISVKTLARWEKNNPGKIKA